jgi:phosphatidylinositol-3-phosphatase
MKRAVPSALVLFIVLCVALTTALAAVPPSNPVVVVVLENHSYASVIGNPTMPYLNSLANKYGLATQYYGNTHPSIGNYFMLTTGQIITNNDSFTATITNDNIVRRFLAKGVTWKSYAEGLPAAGYTGGNTGTYVKRHNPFAYFSDVANSSQKFNIVPFSQFAGDLANHRLPEYSFIVPNICDDAHDCPLVNADTWLKNHIAPLIASPEFQRSGLLVITFDESFTTDTTHGGGHVATLIVSPKAKRGFKSANLYQHQNALRLTMRALGLTSYPGAASTAWDMGTFFP